MALIELNKDKYSVFTDWAEMPFRQYIEYNKVAENVPDTARGVLKWHAELLPLVSNIPADIVDKLNIEQVGGLVGLFNDGVEKKPLDKQGIESFEFEGKVYKCPESRRQQDIIIPMAKMTTDEAVTLLIKMEDAKGEIIPLSIIPDILGALFRLDGEEYNEELTDVRKELFMNLPTSLAMGAYFFLNIRYHSLQLPSAPSSIRPKE